MGHWNNPTLNNKRLATTCASRTRPALSFSCCFLWFTSIVFALFSLVRAGQGLGQSCRDMGKGRTRPNPPRNRPLAPSSLLAKIKGKANSQS
ncbi:hypothetical protein AMTR_s00086p00032850 [Amborella trichopoda]|uniref:Uncharacterized protein n=1 Tax=Amborella trichopoda TaxID=13333 RepID=W1P534_AMBTC|nr:hypothetical protein AMTR_s00086p00032850 [Amborella trichopoda]